MAKFDSECYTCTVMLSYRTCLAQMHDVLLILCPYV